MRAHLILALMVILFVPLVSVAQRSANRRAELTGAQQSVLENEVIPAFQMGSPVAILNALQPLIKKINADQLAAADELLKSKGVPTIAELLSSSRIELVEQNQLGKLPPPRGQDLILTLKSIKDRLGELQALRKTNAIFNDKVPVPDTFLKFERRLWDMHVMQRRLESGQHMTQYASDWQRGAQRMSKKNLSPEDQEILETDFKWLNTELTSMMREVSERSLELRLRRLEFAVQRLTASKDLKDRFQAAFAVDLDGETLTQFFFEPITEEAVSNREQIMFRTVLADPALPPKIQELITQGRAAAGDDLLHKSRLLFTGLHWWYRGRYGLGTEGNGLLKSEAALKSAEAQFMLYMPREIPDPAQAQNQSVQPQQQAQFPRRHYQLWQFETRNISTSFQFFTRGPKLSEDFFL